MSREKLLLSAVVAAALISGVEPTLAQTAGAPASPSTARKPSLELANCLRTALHTDEIGGCMKAERSRREEDVIKAYATLMGRLETPAEQDLLKTSQSAWIDYRAAECVNSVGLQSQGGSLWSAEIDGCYAQKASERAAELNFDAAPQEGAAPPAS